MKKDAIVKDKNSNNTSLKQWCYVPVVFRVNTSGRNLYLGFTIHCFKASHERDKQMWKYFTSLALLSNIRAFYQTWRVIQKMKKKYVTILRNEN